MLRFLTSLLLLVVSTFLHSQDRLQNWSYLLSEPSRDPTYFHLSSENFKEENFEIVRRLDSENLIVRVKKDLTPNRGLLTPINDNWKLNLRGFKAYGTYYIKSVRELPDSAFKNLKVLRKYKGSYVVEGRKRDVLALKQNPAVLHISDEHSKPSSDARVIDMNLNPNRVNKLHDAFPNLDGSDMVISIQENQFRKEDIDIAGRSLESTIGSSITDNHATEMATIVAGAGNSFLTGRGVARNAIIISSDFSDVLPDEDSDYDEIGIQVQNHSYGTEIESFYGVQAEAFDQSARDNPNLLHVFSSGNQGFEVAQDGKYAELEGFSNLTGNFKMAKNVLVVGSVDTVGNVVPFTSNGPAYDGRIKPEIVAYSMAGSSNSAALVSGVGTLLQSQYRNTHAEDMPSALIRALLINASEDVGPAGLDFRTGFGSVNAYRSFESLKEGQFFLGTVADGETISFPINLPANAINLKVTLSWTDPASDIASFKALVNDLDLSVVNSSAEETLPWILNTNSSVEELSTPAVRGIDRLNNNEQVTISQLGDTNLTIEVYGFEVSNVQNFAIAYQYDLENTFEWDYPTANDNMPYNGESGSYFRWNSTLQESAGRLEYSLDDGANWITLAEDVDLQTGYWRWQPPFKLNTQARARMVVGTESYDTGVFTISNPLDVSVGFVCADSVRLQWEKLDNAQEYEIYNMGRSNLEFFASTSDTALVIPDINALDDTRFSVVPVLESGKRLIPSLTLGITQQAIECFIFSFFQEVALDSGIFLNLTLGTTYGIDRVTFERESSAGVVEVTTINSPTLVELRVLDDSPDQGNNTHRVIIDFINGERIEQESSNTFFLTELPILLFPNPSFIGDDVTILTKELAADDPVFIVLDSRGLEVVNIPVKSTQLSIPTFGLEPGMYYYKLVDGVSSYMGRLLIK